MRRPVPFSAACLDLDCTVPSHKTESEISFRIVEDLMDWQNEEFDLGGVNHLALVCSDMKRTVEFYTQVLGMRLIKTINLPGGSGQHFFFDMGGGNALAFFWFPDARDAVPGVSAPVNAPGLGEWISAIGSMNHVAFNVPEER